MQDNCFAVHNSRQERNYITTAMMLPKYTKYEIMMFVQFVRY